ncbi:hypothetical protein PBCVNY2B_720R [Paramecium bursaria Chlorella virus NY2B]|uniref:Uncharacterized protein n=1 Tax=Paramecium bursaria Chlorella virus NYs1 TaxID=83442 RepID=M1I8L6_9PHYC|nr:hypothetical protein AR158_C629R [Paramecium bursaria Chlorella virus AR158]YP_009665504.1 hypothetical protein FK949_gp266 [Paramecium bursaria Chlorella virus NYs1]AGE54357.1 hypothetical protein PBCVIL52s1_731R [Paramecium bursaria Chlorella virus IL-5-2s1]AGE55042.1 hypothetical protein PBCVMA1D_716R [Paramecium bursaria Chlorella virus MA1D]AGE58477.1 hypothetical protein PBCVNY2B_720R [Paramecium bursaria Chlorella virus NY2B]ABU44174.1 hypothetical protein AR158_C629R [Paramecium bur
MPPKKIVRIELSKEGSLEKFGYHVKDPRDIRRKALNKAIADKKTKDALNLLIKRLNVISIYFKNTKPLYSMRAKDDIKYVQKKRDEKYQRLSHRA